MKRVSFKYSGSTSYIWVNCSGWRRLADTLPEIPPSKEAERGTLIHSACEERVLAELGPLGWDGSKYPKDVLAFVEEYWQTILTQEFGGVLGKENIFVEKSLVFDDALSAGGTADLLVLTQEDGDWVTKIIDIKTGYQRVEPSSEQFLFYSVCAVKFFEESNPDLKIARSKCCVYQPSYELPYTCHWFSREEIGKAKDKYLKAIKKSLGPSPRLRAGDWCSWCKAMPICKEFQKYMSKKSGVNLEKVDSHTNALLDAGLLSDEQIVKIIKYSKLIETLLTTTKRYALLKLLKGEKIAGLKVIEGVAKRRWIDEAIAEEGLKSLGIEEPYNKKVIGITEAERLLGKGKIDHLTVKQRGAPLVVLDDDPRPALSLADDLLEALDANEV